jgi:hypothetical protein
VGATKSDRPYSVEAPVNRWKKVVDHEKVWRVRSSKRSTRYSITVEVRARRQRTAKTK